MLDPMVDAAMLSPVSARLPPAVNGASANPVMVRRPPNIPIAPPAVVIAPVV